MIKFQYGILPVQGLKYNNINIAEKWEEIMNKQRRKETKETIIALNGLKSQYEDTNEINDYDELISEIGDIKEKINDLKMEEEDAFYNMPESLQCSERGETMEQNIDYFDEAISSLELIIDYGSEKDISSIINSIDEAVNSLIYID